MLVDGVVRLLDILARDSDLFGAVALGGCALELDDIVSKHFGLLDLFLVAVNVDLDLILGHLF